MYSEHFCGIFFCSFYSNKYLYYVLHLFQWRKMGTVIQERLTSTICIAWCTTAKI